MDRMRQSRNFGGSFAGSCLGYRDLEAVKSQAILPSSQLGRHACGIHVLSHDGQFVLDCLELPDRSSELLSFIRVSKGAVEDRGDRSAELERAYERMNRGQVNFAADR